MLMMKSEKVIYDKRSNRYILRIYIWNDVFNISKQFSFEKKEDACRAMRLIRNKLNTEHVMRKYMLEYFVEEYMEKIKGKTKEQIRNHDRVIFNKCKQFFFCEIKDFNYYDYQKFANNRLNYSCRKFIFDTEKRIQSKFEEYVPITPFIEFNK